MRKGGTITSFSENTIAAIITTFLDQVVTSFDDSIPVQSEGSILVRVGKKAVRLCVSEYASPSKSRPTCPWILRINIYPITFVDEKELKKLGLTVDLETRISCRLEFSVLPEELALLSGWTAEWLRGQAEQSPNPPHIPILLAGEYRFYDFDEDSNEPSIFIREGAEQARAAFGSGGNDWLQIDYLWSEAARRAYNEWENSLGSPSDEQAQSFSIPRIEDSALSEDQSVRESFQLFEQLVVRYEAAFKDKLEYPAEGGILFSELLSDWLFCMLQRSRQLAWGIIDCINRGREIVLVLCVRGLMENLAAICYARSKLVQFYESKINRVEIVRLCFRLRYAMRFFDYMGLDKREEEAATTVNILTMLRSIDLYAQTHHSFKGKARFSEWYSILSEFCHPNHQGIESGQGIDMSRRSTAYQRVPGIRKFVLEIIADPVFMAQYLFFLIYNECWTLLMDNGERLPRFLPESDPRVPLD